MQVHDLIIANHRKTNFYRGGLIAVAVVGLGFFLSAFISTHQKPAYAASPLTFSQYATHPYASKAGFDATSTNYYTQTPLCQGAQSFCPKGQTLIDMEVTGDGKLIAGYGDWAENVDSFGVNAGRVGVVPLDLSNGTWGSMFFAGTEAMDVIKKINGHIYVPTTDPSDKAATGNPAAGYSGYVTNQSGAWTFVRNGAQSSVHTFDVNTLNGTDLWTVGSSASSGAEAKRSVDGGATWTSEQQQPGNWMFWSAVMNGKLYTKSYSEPLARSFNGTTWQDENVGGCLSAASQPRLVVAFDNQIVCGGSSIQSFNGATTTQHATGVQVYDFYQTNGYLYALTNLGIYRTNSLANPFELFASAAIPSDARSLAVYNDYIYLGGNGGKIYKADVSVANSNTALPSAANCFTFNSATGTVTGYGGAGCTSNVVIPESINGVDVKAIGGGAFSNKSLTSIHIPGGVTTIGSNAFSNNNLGSVSIPDSVVSIGSGAFNQARVTQLSLGNALATIGSSAFSKNSISAVTLPSTLTSIGNNAFFDNRIVSVSIPSSVTNLEFNAFANNDFKSITIGNMSPTGSYSDGIFSNRTCGDGIDEVHINSTWVPRLFSSGNCNDDGYADPVTIDALYLGPTVRSLANAAFYQNGLTQVMLPSSLQTIGSYAFRQNALSMIQIPSSVTSIGEYAFWGNQLTELQLPNSVASVGNSAFANNKIVTLEVPSSLTTIGTGVFDGTNNMLTTTTINMPSVPSNLFSDKGITSLTLGTNVTNVAYGAFSRNKITNLKVLGTQPMTFGTYVFSGVNNLLTDAFIDTPNINANLFEGNKIERLSLGPNVQTIGDAAFRYNKITTLTLPASVASVGSSAFASNQIETIFAQGVTTFGQGAFGYVSPAVSDSFINCIYSSTPIPQTLPEYVPCYNSTYGAATEGSFIRLYTPHPENYGNMLLTEGEYSGLIGATPAVIGALIVNPITITTTYASKDGTELQPSVTKIGPEVTDYTFAAARAVKPNFTAADLADMYYQQGESLNATAPSVEGYVTPTAFNGVLPSSPLNIRFTYLTFGEAAVPVVTETPSTPPALPAQAQNTPRASASPEEIVTEAMPEVTTNTDVPTNPVKAGVISAEAPIAANTEEGSKTSWSWMWLIIAAVAALAAWWFILLARRRRKQAQ